MNIVYARPVPDRTVFKQVPAYMEYLPHMGAGFMSGVT